MSKFLAAAALSLAVALSGCVAKTDRISVTTEKIVTKPKLGVKDPPPIKLDPVQWLVVTPENQERVFEAVRASGGRAVLYAVDAKSYRAISLNDAKKLGLIKRQKGVILALRRYYGE